jgi:putative transposase
MGGDTIAGLARRFMVSISYAKKVIRQKRKTGQADLLPQKRGTPRRFLAEHSEHLARLVQADPGQSLATLKGRFLDELGLVVSITQIWRTVNKMDLKLARNKREGPGHLDPPVKSVDGQVEAKPEHGNSRNWSKLAVETLLKETRGEPDLPKKVHTEAEIIFAVKEYEDGEKNATDACRRLDVSQGASYEQQKLCNELEKQQLHELRSLREENDRLKQIVASLMLDRQIIQRIVSKEL